MSLFIGLTFVLLDAVMLGTKNGQVDLSLFFSMFFCMAVSFPEVYPQKQWKSRPWTCVFEG